jgi:hypothetical protein
MDERLTRLEVEMDEMQASVARVEMIRENCPLEPYKIEMKERCQRFTDRITDNKESFLNYKMIIEKNLQDAETRCTEKTKQNRMLIGRLISAIVVLGICLVGVIGGIQISKVSNSEYVNHLEAYRADRNEERSAFNKFLDNYSFDREKRDDKIDTIIGEQRDFNIGIMQQNSLLQQQLEVIKVKLNVK